MSALIATLTALMLFAVMLVGYDWSPAKLLNGNA